MTVSRRAVRTPSAFFSLWPDISTESSQKILSLPTRRLLLPLFFFAFSSSPTILEKTAALPLGVKTYKRACAEFVRCRGCSCGCVSFPTAPSCCGALCVSVCVSDSIQHAVLSLHIPCRAPAPCQNTSMFNVRAGPNYSAAVVLPSHAS